MVLMQENAQLQSILCSFYYVIDSDGFNLTMLLLVMHRLMTFVRFLMFPININQ